MTWTLEIQAYFDYHELSDDDWLFFVERFFKHPASEWLHDIEARILFMSRISGGCLSELWWGGHQLHRDEETSQQNDGDSCIFGKKKGDDHGKERYDDK